MKTELFLCQLYQIGLFIHIREAGCNLKLNQHRFQVMGFADLLVYAVVVEDGVIVGKNGSLMAAWVFCGADTASSTDTERECVNVCFSRLTRHYPAWAMVG